MEVNRPEYRTPREPRAVCVYTIAQESRHIIIENIPSLGLVKDLVAQFCTFGEMSFHSMLDDHPSCTETTDVFYIIYNEISSARKAKRLMDDKVFFTNRLRIYYVPEYESPQDIRDKFNERFQMMQKKCRKPSKHSQNTQYTSTLPSIKREVKELVKEPVKEPVKERHKRRRI